MAKDNGQEPKIEQEMLEELRKSTEAQPAQLSPEQRVAKCREMVAQAQMMYEVVIAISTKNVSPAYVVSELLFVPQEQIRQG